MLNTFLKAAQKTKYVINKLLNVKTEINQFKQNVKNKTNCLSQFFFAFTVKPTCRGPDFHLSAPNLFF